MSEPKSPKLRFAVPPKLVPQIDADAEDLSALEQVFAEMDVDCDQRVTQAEFRVYLKKNPRGWPLADVLAGQSEEIKEQIVNFWFRKLDISSEGSFDKNELIAFFRAMKQTKYKEMLFADFLLNLFDRNYDGKLDRDEYGAMLKVLLGRDRVPKYVLSSVAAEGWSRDDLVALLHSIHCDFSQLDSKASAKGSSTTDLVLVGVVIGVAALAVVVGLSLLKRK